MSEFRLTVRFDGERYEVSLPWNEKKSQLCDNHKSAESRLMSLNRKLDRDPELRGRYADTLNELELWGWLKVFL